MHTKSVQKATIDNNGQTHLYGKLADFMLLGGGSLVALACVGLFLTPVSRFYESSVIVMLVISHFINNPHFAQSYLIFYSNFKDKISASNLIFSLRIRYILFGIAVPIIMSAYFLYFALHPDPQLLVYSIYAMAFFVGWHYVKQGYGMIILDSVLKKNFFSVPEKKILLANAYVCWLASWGLISTVQKNISMFGLNYQNIVLPHAEVVQYISIFAVLFSSGFCLFVLAHKMLTAKRHAPYCGIMAYLTSIYIWLFVAQMNPIFLVIIPAFHSLQYSTIVSKYILNKEQEDMTETTDRKFLFFIMSQAKIKLIQFYFLSVTVGFLGFWGASYFISPFISLPQNLNGIGIFIIITTVFINIHHYFLDNVMWRKENNSVKKYLFK